MNLQAFEAKLYTFRDRFDFDDISLLGHDNLGEHLIDWVDSLHRLSTPSGSELLQPPVSTLLCAMLTDPSTYLLECIKSFFDSMSIQLNQHDKTLSPVRP